MLLTDVLKEFIFDAHELIYIGGNIMNMKKFYYYSLQLIWYCFISFIALTYGRKFGWVFLVVFFIIFYVGDKLITKYFKPKI